MMMSNPGYPTDVAPLHNPYQYGLSDCYSRYHERTISPSKTFEAISPYFKELGISRVGLVTGLDTLDLPVAFATRPNSFTLSVFQGKGVDKASALTSAAMEALETRVAEIVPDSVEWLTLDQASKSTCKLIDLNKTTRCVLARLPSGPLPWVRGWDVRTGDPIKVPWWLAGMDHRPPRPSGFEQSSDGLASGNTIGEAIFHGLCELVERDAWVLARLKPIEKLFTQEVDLTYAEDPVLRVIVDKIGRSGHDLRLLDITSDIGVPAYAALIYPAQIERRPDARSGQVCIGFGCHPTPIRAALRAVTEAAQTRLTAISGSRDDLSSDLYRLMDFDAQLRVILGKKPLFKRPIGQARDADPISVDGGIAFLIDALARVGLEEIVAVPLSSGSLPVSVVRVIVPGLEVDLDGDDVSVGERGARAILEYRS